MTTSSTRAAIRKKDSSTYHEMLEARYKVFEENSRVSREFKNLRT